MDALPGHLRHVGGSLKIDWITGQVVARFRDAGIDPILLKGPVHARWLYPEEPSRRSYGDADLLVPPAELSICEGRLAEMGFDSAWF